MWSYFSPSNFVILAIGTLLAAQTIALDERAILPDLTYDYIVVGGGTAGLAVAKRLSENSSVTVAVIEAGGAYETQLFLTIPAGDLYWCGASPSDTNTQIDWSFVTTPQSSAGGRSVHYARGKCLGGSSARNFMVYQRPTIGSLQKWADTVGDQSYSWNNFLPYYKKSPNFTPPNTSLRANNASVQYDSSAFNPNNTDNPVRLSYPNYAVPFSSWVQGSLNEIGIPTTKDFNSGNLFGTQYISAAIQPANENRESSQTAFLPNLVTGNLITSNILPNLVVYSGALAKKIVFDQSNTATGVVVSGNATLLGSATATINARKEVIVSAGVFQSPQLLMVSGVGPKATLQKFGINVVSNLPGVGQNMQDHVFYGPSYRVNVITATRLANDPVFLAGALAQFELNQGPLTNPNADLLGWEKVPSNLRSKFSASTLSALATLPADWPELEYIVGPGFVGNFSKVTAQPNDGYQYATLAPAIVAPFSRGSVTISSADTSVPPVINPNWLSNTTDQEVAIAGFKRARAAFQSKYMSGVLVDKVETYPGPSVQTDAQILSYVQNNSMTVWHASCTCRMGQQSDPMAVVDTHARVYGVKGLRVVDSSAFPFLPPGHPMSTIYALAEKIAADILSGN